LTWKPSNFLLAQEVHFFAGLAFAFAAPALGFTWWYGGALIILIDLVKELTFDHYVEGQQFIGTWNDSGLVDWTFYIVGVLVAFALLWA
jgi:hypothetical protein